MRKLLCLFILFNQFLFSQEQTGTVIKKIQVGSSYSYSGINGLLGAGISKQKNEFALGFRTSITHFSRYSNAQFMGMYLEYNRFLFQNNKWASLLNVHYGNLFRKLKSPIDDRKSYYQLHEIYFGYGLVYKFQKLSIINTINYGANLQKQTNFYKNEPSIFFHSGPMIKLSLAYDL